MVADGYKQTDVGVIPEDWEVKKLDDITNINIDNLTNSTDLDYLFKYISIEDVKYGVLKNIEEFLFRNAPSRARRKIKQGDILLSTVRPNLKSHLYITSHVNNWICSTGFALLRPIAKFADSGYIYNHLFHSIVNKQINDIVTGSNYPAINSNDVKNILVPIPPKQEQQAIATALSDTDELINSLEKLISKKEVIKTGTMQELLTGKKRLDGFSGEWKEKKLPQICWYQEGPGLRKWQFTNKGMKVINITNLVDGYLNLDKTDRHISVQEFEKMYKHFEIDTDDIVMASSGNSYSKVSIVRAQDLRLLMNTSVIRFKPINGTSYNFLLVFLKSIFFKTQIDFLITGGAQPNFGPAHLKKITIKIPPTPEEQEAIGMVLSNIDSNIEALKTKLSKVKAIKEGMMQKLLTGRTRLIKGVK